MAPRIEMGAGVSASPHCTELVEMVSSPERPDIGLNAQASLRCRIPPEG